MKTRFTGFTAFILTIFILFGSIETKAQCYKWAFPLGSTSNDTIYAMTTDTYGNIYITGCFHGMIDFDPDPYNQELVNSYTNTNLFFAKYDAGGNFIWVKKIGGTYTCGYDIFVDASQNIFLTGTFIGTTNFDTGTNVENIYGGSSQEIFFAKYDPSGNYIWAYSIQSTGDDRGVGIATDQSGNIYLTGYFSATADFNPGTSQNNITCAGGKDFFLAKYNSSGTYTWAYGFGSASKDSCARIKIDLSGNIYLTGCFSSTVNFNPGGSSNNRTSEGLTDIFFAKYNSNGICTWAYNIGSTTGDIGKDILFDNSGNVVITGSFSDSPDFNPGAGTNQLTSGGLTDIFLAKYNSIGTYQWAKKIGSSQNDAGIRMTADASDNIFLTGYFSGSADFDPGTPTVYLTCDGATDIFYSKYSSSGNYMWARKLGTYYKELPTGMLLMSDRYLYLTGVFSSAIDMDPSTDQNNISCEGGSDGFLAKYGPINVNYSKTDASCENVNNGSINLYVEDGISPYTYLWSNGANTNNISNLYAGTYTITIYDAVGSWDSLSVVITSPAAVPANAGSDAGMCPGGSVQLTATGGTSYSWSPSAGLSSTTVYNPVANPTTTTTYIVTVGWAGCYETDTVVVTVYPVPPAFAGNDTSICNGSGFSLNASGGTGYSWTPPTGLSNVSINNPYCNPAITTSYTVMVTNSYGCTATDDIAVTVGNVYQDQNICLVTVDTLTWKNKVIWEKTPGNGTTSYNVYKEVALNDYDLLGTVNAANDGEFVDVTSVPESHGDKYKITVVDTCGAESDLSFYHKTMNLTIAAFGSTMGLNWDEYVDESGLFVPTRYYIYRGTTFSNMALLDSISSSFTSYNDINVFDVYYYMIGVARSGGCNSGTKANYSNSFSNKKDNSTLVGMADASVLTGAILVYPNPMSNSATLTIPNFKHEYRNPKSESGSCFDIRISDLTGKAVREISPLSILRGLQDDSGVFEIERGNLKPGIYFIELRSDRIYRGKLVVE